MNRKTVTSVVDPGTAASLQMAKAALVRAGNDSVRAAWRFGQCIDSHTDDYTMQEIADACDLSKATIYRYRRFYGVYQRPELALQAAEELESYNIDTLYELAMHLDPAPRARPMAGRRFRYTCTSCGSTEVKRLEITGEDEEDEELAEHTQPVVRAVNFRAAQ